MATKWMPSSLAAVALVSLAAGPPQSPLIGQMEQELTHVVAKVRGCVATIEYRPRGGASDEAGSGSLVALDNDGYVITAGIPPTASGHDFVVTCAPGVRHTGVWLGYDEVTGLTLLKTKPGAVNPPQFATQPPRQGAYCLAVGNPYGLTHSISLGNISGVDRRISIGGEPCSGLIQFTAAINPGDAGGMLTDSEGRMIGLIRSSLVDPDVDDATYHRVPSIGFAIPVAAVRQVAAQLKDGHKVEHGYLGIVADAPPEGAGPGLVVRELVPDGPAAKAGLKVGDRIVGTGHDPVHNLDELIPLVENAKPGTKLSLKIVRDGKEQTVEVEVGRRHRPLGLIPDRLMEQLPPLPDALRPDELRRFFDFSSHRMLLGVETQRVTKDLAESLKLPAAEGALVNEVAKGSPADKAGLKSRDCIVAAGGKPVKAPEDLQRLVRETEPGKEIALKVYRDGKPLDLTATLESRSDAAWKFDRRPAPWPPAAPRFFAAPANMRERLENLENRVNVLEKELRELKTGAPDKPEAPKPELKPGGGT